MTSSTFRTGPRDALLFTAVATALLAGCAAPTPVQPTQAPEQSAAKPASAAPQPNPQLAIRVGSGTYRCEHKIRVDIKPDPGDVNRINVGWKGRNFTLTRHDSYSGLPRFEDQANQLVWVVLPWKSLLLDGRSGQPLANECKLS